MVTQIYKVVMRPGARFGETLIARSDQAFFGDLPRKCQSNDYLTTWRFVCGLTSRAEKIYNQAKTRAHEAQMIRGGALGEWDVCLLCFFRSPVA